MLPIILLSLTVMLPWEFQVPGKDVQTGTSRHERPLSAVDAVPPLLNRMLKLYAARGEDLPLVMVYGIEAKPGSGVDPFRILERTETWLAESKGMRLYRDEYRVQFEREMGYQAIERIPRSRMLEYARDMGSRYLLSGHLSRLEAQAESEPKAADGAVAGKLTFVLTDTATGDDIWSESMVYVESPSSGNQLSVKKHTP